MSESSSDEDILTPSELVQVEHNAELSFLPEKSREKYLKAYDLFNAWRHSKGAKSFSDSLMLTYFIELSKTRKSSTLWSIYSMLKATIKAKNGIHIEKYSKLLAFIKNKSSGHIPKKSRIFTTTHIEQFLNEAPDSEYLATKVVLIIGISGACRTNELTYLTTKNIEKHSDKLLLVKLSNTKTNIDRNFVIRDEYVKIVDKYRALRPANTPIDRFFLQYRKGKCVKQPMGSTKIGGLPREIATFLGLQEPEQYTGHCFRRTSATLLADSGADLTTLKRHGDWKSSTVAEVYIQDSIENKSKICKGNAEEVADKNTTKHKQKTSNGNFVTEEISDCESDISDVKSWQSVTPPPAATVAENLASGSVLRIDYAESLREMLARRKGVNESMAQYFYKKNSMLTKLEIFNERAVACIVDGLPVHMKALARAENFTTPADLYFNFLAVIDSKLKVNQMFGDPAEYYKADADPNGSHYKDNR